MDFFSRVNKIKGKMKSFLLLVLLFFAILSTSSIVVIYPDTIEQSTSWDNLKLPSKEVRIKRFENIRKLIKDNYCHFDVKDVNWDEIYMHYFSIIENADSIRKYVEAYYNLLGELNDGHADVISPPLDFGFIKLGAKWIGKSLFVSYIYPESDAEKEGIKLGAEIISIEGMTVEEKLNSLPKYYVSGHTPQFRKQRARSALFRGEPGTKVKITLKNPDRGVRDVELTRFEKKEITTSSKKPTIEAKFLEEGLGLLNANTFEPQLGVNLIEQIDKEMEKIFDAPSIIIDTRRCPGGSSKIAEHLAGYFVHNPCIYAVSEFKSNSSIVKSNWEVTPHKKRYNKPVAVLIDTNFSSAHSFIQSLRFCNKDIILIGSSTGGGGGIPGPLDMKVPGGIFFRLPTARVYYPDGTLTEIKGIDPDIQIEWTVSDLIEGKDPDITAAKNILREKLK